MINTFHITFAIAITLFLFNTQVLSQDNNKINETLYLAEDINLDSLPLCIDFFNGDACSVFFINFYTDSHDTVLIAFKCPGDLIFKDYKRGQKVELKLHHFEKQFLQNCWFDKERYFDYFCISFDG